MTMHLMHAGFSTTNTRPRKSRKTPALLKAEQEHDAWLRKQGLHPDQLAQRTKDRNPGKFRNTARPVNPGSDCSNGFAPGGAKKSVFDTEWQRRYEEDPVMAERERLALMQAEQKKSRVAPAYSKGAYQFITDDADLKTLGRKV